MNLKNSVFINKVIFSDNPIDYDYSEKINELEKDELEDYLEITFDEFKLLKKKLKINKNKEFKFQSDKYEEKIEIEIFHYYLLTKDEDIFDFKFKNKKITRFRSYISNSFIARFRIWLEK